MNGPGDLPLQHYSSTPDANNCSIISIIPNLGMSSCRGRAEAFARRLSSKLRTLGSQTDDTEHSQEDEPIINGGVGASNNTWVSGHENEQTVTDLQPLRHESDSFFDFDCELESPGSPVDECEYLRLIESTSNTPHNSAPESGYACASAASSHSSSDGPYYDVNSENESSQQQIEKLKKPSPLAQQPLTRQPRLSECDEVDCAKVPSPTAILNLCNGHDSGLALEESSQQTPESQHISNKVTKSLPSEGPDIEEINSIPKHPDAIFKRSGRAPTLQEQILHELQKQSQDKTDEDLEGEKNKQNLADTTAIDIKLECKSETETKIEPEVEIKPELEPKPESTHEPKAEPIHAPTHEPTHDPIHEPTHEPTPEPTNEPKLEPKLEPKPEPIDEPKLEHKPTPNVSVSEKEEEQICKVIHSLINGHAENGEDVLKIEVVCELEIPSQELHAEQSLTLEEPKVQEFTETTTEVITDHPISEQLTIDTELSAATQEEAEEPVKKTQHTGLHHDTTDDEDDCRPQRVRRCSSLKTGKTPPGTPGRKKIVRFADVLGLDLADIKTFLDEVPTVPKSAYEDLEILESEAPIQLGPKSDKLLMPLFQQPAALATFLDIVRANQVSLENAAVTDTINQTITGSVRVRNLDFHKSVHIRYSLDGWRSFADLQANYVENSCDGFSDKFTFILFGNSLHIGQRLEFAVRFQCKGQQYWDNNYGANYCFQCLPNSTTPTPVQMLPSHHANNMVGLLSPTAGDAWCSSFY